jgi:BirA family biotin operon repressor/biotin-[acetyl-CoA-carboxylase] ligase
MLVFNDKQKKILNLLADGCFHSGTELASALSISRAAIWKHIASFNEYGIEIISLRGRGYKLHRPLELLSATLIEENLTGLARQLLSTLEIYHQIDSTNRYLADLSGFKNLKGLSTPLSGSICFAEYQTAGKGRRGRQWVSPFGTNLYFSILWQFQQDPASIAGLSLAVGVAVIRALKELGITEVGLKWPNDIYWREKKLGGILIEVAGEAGGCCSAVIGLGLNLYLPAKETGSITQPWTDLEHIIKTGNIRTGSPLKDCQSYSRNVMASLLLNQLLPVIANFENDKLAAYLTEWRNADVMLSKEASIYLGSQEFSGTVMGIDDNGMLLLKNAAGMIKTFASGEVSFRQELR